MKAICPVCKRVICVRIPKGGDGTVYLPRKHWERERVCDGWFYLLTAKDLVTGKG